MQSEKKNKKKDYETDEKFQAVNVPYQTEQLANDAIEIQKPYRYCVFSSVSFISSVS